MNASLRSVVIATLVSTAVAPAPAAVIYNLSGILEWQSTHGPDRLSLDGPAYSLGVEIIDVTADVVRDPNGLQARYDANMELSIGGSPVNCQGALVSFFISSSGQPEVANILFDPDATDPRQYYAAVGMVPGANSDAAARPPAYLASAFVYANLNVPGLGLSDPNAIYRLLNVSFSATETAPPVPEPNNGQLAGGARAVAAMFRHFAAARSRNSS